MCGVFFFFFTSAVNGYNHVSQLYVHSLFCLKEMSRLLDMASVI